MFVILDYTIAEFKLSIVFLGRNRSKSMTNQDSLCSAHLNGRSRREFWFDILAISVIRIKNEKIMIV